MMDMMFKLLGLMIKSASPQIIADLQNMVQELVDKAKTTPNPVDDFLAMLLQMLIGKPGEQKS